MGNRDYEFESRNSSIQNVNMGRMNIGGDFIHAEDIYVENGKDMYSIGDQYGYNRQNKFLRWVYVHIPEKHKKGTLSKTEKIGLIGSIASIIGLLSKFLFDLIPSISIPVFASVALPCMAIFKMSYMLNNPNRIHKCPVCSEPYSIRYEFLEVPEDSYDDLRRGYQHKWCAIHGCEHDVMIKDQIPQD